MGNIWEQKDRDEIWPSKGKYIIDKFNVGDDLPFDEINLVLLLSLILKQYNRTLRTLRTGFHPRNLRFFVMFLMICLRLCLISLFRMHLRSLSGGNILLIFRHMVMFHSRIPSSL